MKGLQVDIFFVFQRQKTVESIKFYFQTYTKNAEMSKIERSNMIWLVEIDVFCVILVSFFEK